MNEHEQKQIKNELYEAMNIDIAKAKLILQEKKEQLKQAQKDLIYIINYYNKLLSNI